MKQFTPFVIVGLLVLRLGAATAGEPPQFKTRALWVDPSGFSTAEATDKMIARCERAGINLILPCVMSHGATLFKSRHFRGRVMANSKFDPLAHLLRKARAAGIQVQPWCCVYYEGAGQPAKPEWLTLSFDRLPFEKNFLSPANPEVNPYLLSVLADLLAYDIDGIHLDYIRYPGTVYDYSEPARKAFQSCAGFDPMDFLDHPERIVPAEKEPFPIRVLHPKIHAEKVWETTAIERTLDQAGVGFAFVSETPENIVALRVPGLLIISSCYDVPPAMVQALTEYATRGGNILWTDVPARSLARSPALQQLTGIAAARWIGERRISLRPVGEHPLARVIPTAPFTTESLYAPTLNGAKLIAELDSGEPAVTLNRCGKGCVMVLGFHIMKSTSTTAPLLARGLVDWFKAEAGFNGPDPLAAERAQWVKWRADQVTQLVLDLRTAARKRNPRLVISTSGGPSPWELYACYRDARRWLAEGLNEQVFPMNYTPDPLKLADMLGLQTASAPAGKRDCIFPGLQIYAQRTVDGKRVTEPMDAALVEQELRVVQQSGYHGFCLFAYNSLSDETIEVVRKFSHPAK